MNRWLVWGHDESMKMLEFRKEACGDDGGGVAEDQQLDDRRHEHDLARRVLPAALEPIEAGLCLPLEVHDDLPVRRQAEGVSRVLHFVATAPKTSPGTRGGAQEAQGDVPGLRPSRCHRLARHCDHPCRPACRRACG